MKALQEKMKLDDKEAKRFSPVDAFPGDIVIFARVLNLLRGLSATMEVRIVYFDIMRPFAESVLGGIINMGPATNTQWLCDTPVHSDVEGKLRKLLIDLGNAGKILGIQKTSVSPPRTSLATQHLSITAPQKTSNMAAKRKQTAAQ
ncbi:uncharacterized protein LOC110682895 isoform X2 [Chenopodium quinoa]|uniref:uncharacterized protein LOC110682895 isoform X2 n=1 Tax=Chenopodium quinoa TaxID=63459 RepID=UPI000B78D2B0|nr:uncharacterized protein LOC110682895 isoform X2 [Chenopodium quinoa]